MAVISVLVTVQLLKCSSVSMKAFILRLDGGVLIVAV